MHIWSSHGLPNVPLLRDLFGLGSLLLDLAALLRLDLLSCGLLASSLLGRGSLSLIILLALRLVHDSLLASAASTGRLLWFSAVFFVSLLLDGSATLLRGWSGSGSGSVFLFLVFDLSLGLGLAGTLLRSWGWSFLVIFVFGLVLNLLALGSGLLLGLLLCVFILFLAFLGLLSPRRLRFLIPKTVGFRILV
jgi:hypothetical protein